MVNRNLLAGKIVAAGLTQGEMAKALGMSKNTFSAKINGKSLFNTDQVGRTCEILKIHDDREKAQIFFGKTSQ